MVDVYDVSIFSNRNLRGLGFELAGPLVKASAAYIQILACSQEFLSFKLLDQPKCMFVSNCVDLLLGR